MTFSIVATDGEAWGVAVASKFLATGAVVPAARIGAGALATQAWVNVAYGADGLALLADGADAATVVQRLTDADARRAERQLGVVDAAGRSASYTGAECLHWAGGRTGDGYAVQGNILTGPDVVDAMVSAWEGTDASRPLAQRLLAALAAGDRAGGDSRGRQSAAVYVLAPGAGFDGATDVAVDLRVDDHRDPVTELGRLLDLHEVFFTAADPADALPLEGELAAEVAQLLDRAGQPVAGDGGSELDAALAGWAGRENYESRLLPGAIDPLVLDRLRAAVEQGS